jgi:hypothetical protein
MSEATMYPLIGRYLIDNGWRVSFQVPPRPGSPRRFDVVGVNAESQVNVVEAKVDHYRRAMEQACARLFVADFVNVSFPETYATRVLKLHAEELTELGIGLLAVDGSVNELMTPAQSAFVNTQRKMQLMQMAERVGEDFE